MLLFAMVGLISVANADSSTITSCYSTAESENTGLLVTVKLGSTTELSSSDLDAVFDKIAEHHADSTLNLTYNGNGRTAMKSALDCIFDAEHLTVSSIWVNENVSDLSVRGYTGVYYDGSPTDLRYFAEVVTRSSEEYVKLQGTQGVQDCAELKVASLGNNDRFGLVTSMWTKCVPTTVTFTRTDGVSAAKRKAVRRCLGAGKATAAPS